MTGIYGVFDPGFPVGSKPTSMLCDGAAQEFFRRYGVPADWGMPTHAAVWCDSHSYEMRGAVANYRNGKQPALLPGQVGTDFRGSAAMNWPSAFATAIFIAAAAFAATKLDDEAFFGWLALGSLIALWIRS